MFTFLSQFYDENPTILSVIFCLTLLLWIYFVLSDFFKFCTNQNRFDTITLAQKKRKSSKISKESLCKSIAWINGKNGWTQFSFLIIQHFSSSSWKQLNLFYMQTKTISHFICMCLHSANRMQQIFHKYTNKFCGAFHRERTANMEWVCK